MGREEIRRVKAVTLIVCLLVVNLLTAAMPTAAATAMATTLRLTAVEGTAEVKNQNGRAISQIPDMKLYNGYQLSTQAASYAYIGLDDTKAVKLDEVSEAEMRQHGKELEVMLNSGELFFNVTAPLAADENLNIRTSTMVTGIRGTCGWIQIVDDSYSELFLLEGVVQLTVLDPVTGETETKTVHAGQRARVYVYKQWMGTKKVDIIIEQMKDEDIPGFVLMELWKDPELVKKIQTETGLLLSGILDRTEEILKADQKKMAEKLAVMEQAKSQQLSQKIVDPVFKDSTTTDSGDSTGGGSVPVPTRGTITLSMPITATELNRYLKDNDVILNSGGTPQTLQIDTGVTVPAGGALTIQTGVPMVVNPGNTLQIDGHFDTSSNVTNQGTINNTSTNTFLAQADLVNAGSLNNTGRLVTSAAFTNSGSINSGNILEIGAGFTNSGSFTSTGTLTVAGSWTHAGGNSDLDVDRLESLIVTGGTLKLKRGTVIQNGIKVNTGGELFISGGTIQAGTSGAAIQSSGVVRIDPDSPVMIIGGAGYAIDTSKIQGQFSINNMANVHIRADSAAKLFAPSCGTLEIRDAYDELVEWNPSVYLMSADKADKGYEFKQFGESVTVMLEDAQAGETVTLPVEGALNLDPLDGEGVYVLHGNSDEPVTLDLNGGALNLTGNLVIGDGSGAGALRIMDSAEKKGSLNMDTENDFLEIFPHIEITEGSSLNIQGSRIYSELEESVVIYNSGGVLTLTGDDAVIENGSGPLVFLGTPDARIVFEDGGSLIQTGMSEGTFLIGVADMGEPEVAENFIGGDFAEIKGKTKNIIYDVSRERPLTSEELAELTDYEITEEPDSEGYFHLVPKTAPTLLSLLPQMIEIFYDPEIPYDEQDMDLIDNLSSPSNTIVWIASPSDADAEEAEATPSDATPEEGTTKPVEPAEPAEPAEPVKPEEIPQIPKAATGTPGLKDEETTGGDNA